MIASSFHCHTCWLEFKTPLLPAKKQKTLACIREIQVHKLWNGLTQHCCVLVLHLKIMSFIKWWVLRMGICCLLPLNGLCVVDVNSSPGMLFDQLLSLISSFASFFCSPCHFQQSHQIARIREQLDDVVDYHQRRIRELQVRLHAGLTCCQLFSSLFILVKCSLFFSFFSFTTLSSKRFSFSV